VQHLLQQVEAGPAPQPLLMLLPRQRHQESPDLAACWVQLADRCCWPQQLDRPSQWVCCWGLLGATAAPSVDDASPFTRFFFGASNVLPFFFDGAAVPPGGAFPNSTVSLAASAELLNLAPFGAVSGWMLAPAAAAAAGADAMMDCSIRLLRLIFSARSCSS